MKSVRAQMDELMETILRVRYSDVELELRCAEELLKLANENNSTYGKAFAFTYLGDYYVSQNDAEMCGQYLHWARKLCVENDFTELYLRACHLTGFYYHLIYDEQNALEFYLESIKLSEKLGNVRHASNTQNNIADMFQCRGDYEMAKEYYLKAYEPLEAGVFIDDRMLLMVMYNLSELVGATGDPDGMDRYLEKGEALIPNNEEEQAFQRLCTMSGRCVQAAYKGENARAIEIAKSILSLKLHELNETYLVIELIFPIAQALVKMGEAECAKSYIDILVQHTSLSETNFMQRLLRLKVQYAEKFLGGEELDKSYKEYYQKMQSIMEAEKKVRVNGMKAKIYLQEAIRKNESTQRENKRLEDVANLDALTGVSGRRYFDDHFLKAASDKKSGNFGIIMLDVDRFKEYNDTYGHMCGDNVLREIGAALKAYSSRNIRPCRYGGDEFACLCYDCKNSEIETYINQVENYIKCINIEHAKNIGEKRVTLSIGYSNKAVDDNFDADDVLARADKALYISKENGRNCWSCY